MLLLNEERDVVQTEARSIDWAYTAIAERAGPWEVKTLQRGAPEFLALLRRYFAQKSDAEALAALADRWLMSKLGRVDDVIRQAGVAVLALRFSPQACSLPAEIQAIYPEMHMDLARCLAGPHAYNAEAFARDVMMVTGALAPVGAFLVTNPARGSAVYDGGARVKHAAGSLLRHAVQEGPTSAVRWLAGAGAKPWTEMHLDARNLRNFNAEGFHASYRRMAAFVRLRPDLAGATGASWLYDPQLSRVSPKLAFVRETAEEGGGHVIRLRTDPVQISYALARSPQRRQLYESGRYKPACYAMYWPRRALLDWDAKQSRMATVAS
jgi:hypothetical protein